MLTLDAVLQIPTYVLFTLLGNDAVLVNVRTNHYFSLDEVGARLWDLLSKEKPLREVYHALLDEYGVDPAQLEQDILELINLLEENGLVEVVQR